MGNIYETEPRIGDNGNGARPEKRIASELRCSPTMEKIIFGEALEPYLTMLESLGATPVDVEKTYLKINNEFSFRIFDTKSVASSKAWKA